MEITEEGSYRPEEAFDELFNDALFTTIAEEASEIVNLPLRLISTQTRLDFKLIEVRKIGMSNSVAYVIRRVNGLTIKHVQENSIKFHEKFPDKKMAVYLPLIKKSNLRDSKETTDPITVAHYPAIHDPKKCDLSLIL